MNGDEYVFYHVMRFSFKQDQNLDSDAVFYDVTFALHATAYTYHSIIFRLFCVEKQGNSFIRMFLDLYTSILIPKYFQNNQEELRFMYL